MSNKYYPAQGAGIRVDKLNWKDPDLVEELDIKCEVFHERLQKNGVMAYIEILFAEGDAYYLITYSGRPYEETPFVSLGELQEFYVGALREHVTNTDEEIRDLVEDLDLLYFA